MGDLRVIGAVENEFAKAPQGTTGKVLYVDSGASGASDVATRGRTRNSPLATLDYAIGLCSANNGDVIYVMPGHAETTTAIALDVAGVSIIGIGTGRSCPAFTATTAATDLLNVSAANCLLQNLRFVGAASGNTALLDVAADDLTVQNCVFNPAATPLKTITIASGHRGRILDCRFLATANGPDIAIEVESSGSDFWIVKDCLFNAAAGWDDGVIRHFADQGLGWIIDNCTFLKCDTLAIDFNSSASVSDGIVRNCTFHATAAIASIEDIIDVGGYHFDNCFAHDGTNNSTAMARIPLGTVS